MAMIKCPKCGKDISDKGTICPGCMTPMAEIMEIKAAHGSTTKKKNVLLLISAILGILYAVYIVVYFMSGSDSASTAEAIGAGTAAIIVMPHMICATLAAIFNTLGWSMNSRGFALTGAILYSVAAVLFPLYALFVVIQIVLSFVGFAQLKKNQ